MEQTKSDIVLVTIGLPFSKIPIANKVLCFVDESTDTPVTVAKKLRKMIVNNIQDYGFSKDTLFHPSDLYYEVYITVDDTLPKYCSDNAPGMNKAC